ncbi:MAG: NAD(P)/FAD-dependent oxidoreductase [Bryobacteraceae bacterium]
MSETADVIVIGAGIVGAACADALSREGLRVSVVESGPVGGGATAAGMGHIVVMDDSEAQFALTNYSRNLWNALASELPREIEYERRGTLWVAADDEEMGAVRSKQAYYTARGVRVEALDEKALAAAEPNLRAGLAGALRVPDDAVIYAPRAAQWLLDRARLRGATVLAGSVTAMSGNGVVLSDGTRVSGAVTICSAGTRAVELFPGLNMRPRKGHLAITDRYPGFVHHQLVELGYLKSAHGHSNESVAFNVQPRATGQLLIGSSRQYGAAHSGVDSPFLGRMLQRAVEYMPGLARLSVIRTWTGFRAATGDSLPVIGPCPGREGVYLATGHEGLGITTSLGTAAMLADLILHRPPAIALEPYLPRTTRDHS